MLDISSLDIFNKNIADKSDLMFRESGELKYEYIGHSQSVRQFNFVSPFINKSVDWLTHGSTVKVLIDQSFNL